MKNGEKLSMLKLCNGLNDDQRRGLLNPNFEICKYYLIWE